MTFLLGLAMFWYIYFGYIFGWLALAVILEFWLCVLLVALPFVLDTYDISQLSISTGCDFLSWRGVCVSISSATLPWPSPKLRSDSFSVLVPACFVQISDLTISLAFCCFALTFSDFSPNWACLDFKPFAFNDFCLAKRSVLFVLPQRLGRDVSLEIWIWSNPLTLPLGPFLNPFVIPYRVVMYPFLVVPSFFFGYLVICRLGLWSFTLGFVDRCDVRGSAGTRPLHQHSFSFFSTARGNVPPLVWFFFPCYMHLCYAFSGFSSGCCCEWLGTWSSHAWSGDWLYPELVFSVSFVLPPYLPVDLPKDPCFVVVDGSVALVPGLMVGIRFRKLCVLFFSNPLDCLN